MSRQGFSVLEVTVANLLLALLAIVASSSMIHLGRPMIDQSRRVELHEQAELARRFLSQDLGGQLARVITGPQNLGKEVGRQVLNESELRICFDGGSADGIPQWSQPDSVLRYYHVGDALIRFDEQTQQKITVAKYVSDFIVTSNSSDTTIVITFLNRKVDKSITFVASSP
jgi:type II secretory pathway component PulJ